MSKKIHQLMGILAIFALMFGNVYITAGASSEYGVPMPQSQVTAPPAFPGAEGFGANTVGGRGGKIIEVTNLNDSGVGSMRACVEASGARTCVFRTGGLIELQAPLKITNPYITIAGQTAPGDGITIKLGTATEAFLTQTHDVIIRYITIRAGPGGENHANQIAKNGIELYNIIIDHNSLSWGVDSNIETWYRVRDATIQWSLISEGLNNSTHSKGAHSKGIMIGGYQGSESGGKGSENISILNNLMAHNSERNPLMQLCGIAQVINNTTYNPQWTFSHQQLNCPLGESYVNWINNYHKKGPSSTSNSDLKIIPADSGTWSPGKVYVKGNIGPNRPNDTLPETNWVEVKSGAPAGIIVTSPAPAPIVYSTNAMEAYNSVIADRGVGNSQGLDCNGNWYSRRDSIDARIINEVKTGTGNIIDDPSQVGGWIVPNVGVPCADGDHDGMPDSWEQLHGFNPNNPDVSGDKDGDGYTDVEEYLNGTNPLDSIVPSTDLVVVTGISPTSGTADSVNFTVMFSKSVTGVDVNDFSLTTNGISGATVSGVSGSDNVYAVTVNTGSGDGTIRLDILETASIEDLFGNAFVGPYTSGEIYTVDRGTAPTVPVLKSPANGALVTGYLPTLDWNDSSQVMALAVLGWHYEIQVTSSDGYSQNFNTVDNADPLLGLGASQYTFTTPLPANTTFSWKVRSYNDNNQYSAWSAARTFRTKLATPMLNLPENGTTLNNKRPTFEWDEVPGATTYTMQILKGTKIVRTGTIKAPTHTYISTADLLPSTTYTWKVKANGTNAGNYSAPFTFTTSGNPPKMPVLSAPSNGVLVDSTVARILKWKPVLAVTTTSPSTTYPAAQSYEVEYATNTAFIDSTIAPATTTELNIGSLHPGRTYYWRIRSWSGAGGTGNHSAWSLVRTIKVKFVAPTLTSPASAATDIPLRPTFTWDAAGNGLWTDFTLQVATNDKFTTGLRSFTINAPTTKYTIPATLPALTPGTQYHWRVKINGLYTPITSASWSFTTAP